MRSRFNGFNEYHYIDGFGWVTVKGEKDIESFEEAMAFMLPLVGNPFEIPTDEDYERSYRESIAEEAVEQLLDGMGVKYEDY